MVPSPNSYQSDLEAVKDGYRLLSDTGLDDHKFLILKAKFFSLPDWGDHGTVAKVKELFIRETKGTTGKPSVYKPSPWLVQRLSGVEAPEQAKAAKTHGKAKTAAGDRDRKQEVIRAMTCSDSTYYNTPYYKGFVQEVKERDRCTCQACGKKYDSADMRVVCLTGFPTRIRNPDNYACACKKCATLHGAINRGDDEAAFKHSDDRIKLVVDGLVPGIAGGRKWLKRYWMLMEYCRRPMLLQLIHGRSGQNRQEGGGNSLGHPRPSS